MSPASRCSAPREGLECLLVKRGRGLQAGKSGDPRSQDTDSSPRAQGALGLGFEAKPRGKCGAPCPQQLAALIGAWRLIRRGCLRFPTLPRQLPN